MSLSIKYQTSQQPQYAILFIGEFSITNVISHYAHTYVLLIFTITFYINKLITYFSILNVTMFYQKAEGRWTGSKKWRLERGFFFYCFTLQIEHNYWNNTIVPTSEPYVFTYFAPWIRWFSYKKYWGEE